MQKYGKKEIIILTSFAILLLGIIAGVTYAWFSVGVVGNDEAKVITVETAQLKLKYTEVDNLVIDKGFPGASDEKIFEVENIGTAVATYDIVITDVSTTFLGEDLVYEIRDENNNIIKSETVLPNTGDTLLSNIDIDVREIQRYKIKIIFKETYSNQNSNMGVSYSGKLEIVPRTTNGAIAGYVYGIDGNTLKQKRVEFNSEPIWTITDEEGYYEFGSLPVGQHTLYVKDGNEILAQRQINLAFGLSTSINGNTLVMEKKPSKYVIIRQIAGNNINITVEEAKLMLSETSGEIYVGGTKEVTISGTGYGVLSCESDDISKATCSISNNTLFITGVSTGEGTITVRENKTNASKTYTYESKMTSISLSETSGEKIIGTGKLTANISGTNMGTLWCGTTSDQIATCEIEGNTLIITPVGVGASTITVREDNGNQSVTYEATIKQIEYIVEYNGNENTGGSTASSTHTYGTEKALTSNGYTKTGYTFVGWKINNVGATYIDGQSVNNLSSTNGEIITMYAQWEINTYTLNLVKETGVASITATGCAVVTAGSKYTCTYGANVKVTATVSSSEYGLSTTLIGTNIANKTNNKEFIMPVPTSGNSVTLKATAQKKLYNKIIADNSNGKSDSNISFSGVSGAGLYYTSNLSYGENNTRVYYYRGRVDNNWVNLGGYKWRIVRTTSEGGVKLIYAGNGSTSTSGFITPATSFSTNYTAVSSIKYSTSTLKGKIDVWYANWIKTQTVVPNYLSTTAVYCNDTTGSTAKYNGRQRIEYSHRPSYQCPTTGTQGNSSYTKANGLLTYPIAILSADEVSYAGLVCYPGPETTQTYIVDNASDYWWTMTPTHFISGEYAYNFRVNSTGLIVYNYVGNTHYIRPSVSLKACVTYTGIGNGSKTTPYEISDTAC